MLSTCPLCYRVYWTNGKCDHGGKPIIRPSVIKDEPKPGPKDSRTPPDKAAKNLLDDLEGK